MNRANVAAFAQRSAEQRRDVWSTSAIIGGVTMDVIYSAPSQTQKLDEGGWDPAVIALARVLRSAMPARLKLMLQQTFNVAGEKFLIAQIKDHPAHPEIVVGLKEP